ncbi:MAG: ATP-binding protein [Granulosicoccus sp.]
MALLIASALLILLMYIISSWSFSRGLLNYVNQAAVQEAQSFAEELGIIHEDRQSWEWARGASPEWHALGREKKSRQARPPPRGRRAPRYLLADASKRRVVGPPPGSDSAVQWVQITGQSDSVVGYLGFLQQRRLDSQLDRAFETQQKKSFAFAGAGMVLLCALLAVPMASLIVKPILRIGEAVENIRQGEFHHRVSSRRRDELGALAGNINLLAQTLEKNRDVRQRWIAEISHELRTPISILRGELEAMQDGIRPVSQRAVESLHAEVMGLNRLVDDLHTLSLSDVGALDYRFDTINIVQMLTEFFDNNQAALADASMTLSAALGSQNLAIKGDGQRLQQMWSNLYQNSIRYSDRGGSLVVKAQRIAEDKLQVLWSDSSPGVPDDALPKLFDPLFRVEQSRNRASGGAGLGLCIVSRIVQAHNGTITAAHSQYGGLEIDIRFPIAVDDV